MAGKRILDLAALFNASRRVAQKHIALKTRQIDVYNRTSTLARGVRNQTDRVTETVKAASFLVSRLNDNVPEWTKEATENTSSSQSNDGGLIPSKRSTKEEEHVTAEFNTAKLNADKSPAISQVEPTPDHINTDDAKRIQRESEYQIPSITADTPEKSENPLEEGHDRSFFYNRSKHTSPALSSLPRAKIPKHTSDFQGDDKHLNTDGINSDTFSETVDVFHSPRVARLLGGETQESSRRSLGLKGVKDTPVDHTKLATNKDQDTFNVRSSVQTEPTSPDIAPRPVSDTPRQEDEDIEKLAADISKGTSNDTMQQETIPQPAPYKLRESSIPSSRLGRLWNYSGLAAGMVGGAISESLRRACDKVISNERCSLEIGSNDQFPGLKDAPCGNPRSDAASSGPRRLYACFTQRNKVLKANLGPEWRDLFGDFEEVPLAAASIGQVHRATLKSTGAKVAVKIQYPGVADSIDSDLNNLAILLTASRLLPKGLFLDKTIANARTELGWECDYIREAECGLRFQELLADEKDVFVVPKVYSEASGKQVLTMEYMEGVGVTRVQSFTQEQRDWIGTQILRLCLREITEFKYMQTDPNWTNFLYNAQTNKLELLDFGASREYPEQFITKYTQLLNAASRSDRKYRPGSVH
ncbi:hypothetical protein DID88_004902 [Monilinia fructigena]|uniref:ABC1 atypical kinase-like domain-containing protein n=1 Tax=Monilinia fructigena TaxID=38457 RepID=A0A395IQI2_9HELO|nr:hypothetical protein DID88_004902 [Monilinia fructigena]